MGFFYDHNNWPYKYQVAPGDTVSAIASKFSNVTGQRTTAAQLISLNGIKGVDTGGGMQYSVVKGEYLTMPAKKETDGTTTPTTPTTPPGTTGPGTDGGGGGSSVKVEPTQAVTTKPVIVRFGIQSNSDNLLYASWDWDKEKTESYKAHWTYSTKDGIWFEGSANSITVDKDDPNLAKQSTYTIPDNARQVRFRVKAISESQDKNNADTKYWTAPWSDYKYHTIDTPLDVPAVPTVEIEKYKLTATLDNLEDDANKIVAKQIEFQVVKDNASKVYKSGKAAVTSRHASWTCDVAAGSEYKVRCRAINGTLYSDWSDYSDNMGTMPSAPSKITEIRAESETSVYLSWSKVNSAETYVIQYTTKKEYFEGSDQLSTKSTDGPETQYRITGLETGTEYFFRVRAVNEFGESGWSAINSIAIGKAPAAPTTWSSSTKVIAGEELTLYWVHNAADGSSEKYAKLELYFNNSEAPKETHTIKKSTEEDEKDKTSFYKIDTSAFVEGTTIEWRVQTAGITDDLGEWSVKRTVDIYAPVTLEVNVTDQNGDGLQTVTEFPFYIRALAGPDTQIPIGYHLSIVANEMYDTVDNIGNERTINAGEEVYSRYFDITDDLVVELTPGSVDLENSIGYTVTCTVSMDSGLTAEASVEFVVSWTDMIFEPNAEIGLIQDTMTTYIRPYCQNSGITYYKVEKNGLLFTRTDTVLDPLVGQVIRGSRTTMGDLVYDGTTIYGEELYFCAVVGTTEITNVYLSVYRREFDGKFTELATGLDGAKHTTVTDPHPALDYARYRIVAITKDTGAVSYADLPGYPIQGKSVIIQWDEAWTNFETDETAALEQPAWSGSLLKLPYNIDVSESNTTDVEHIEYIGREHPVSYYGTQLGETSTWNVTIDKNDKETIYALRRLAKWMGDVYVREPSGLGYWASISISFSQKHCEVTIPVTLEITRVEGGV